MKFGRAEADILAELQRDGRLSNVDLSRRVKLSESPCLRKTRALEKAGVISGYRATVSPERVGFGLTALVFVNLDQRSETDTRAFFNWLAREPQVLECSAITGVSDLLLRVLATDKKDLARLTMDQILRFSSVKDISTSIVLREIKETAPIPV